MAQMCGIGVGVGACPSWRKISLLEADNASLRRQLQVLTAEVSLVLECLRNNFGLSVVNPDSFYFNMLHGEGSMEEVDNIKRSLMPVSQKTDPNEVNEEPPGQVASNNSGTHECVNDVETTIDISGNVVKHFRNCGGKEDVDPVERDNPDVDNLGSKIEAQDSGSETQSGLNGPGSSAAARRSGRSKSVKKRTSLRSTTSTDRIKQLKKSTRRRFKCQYCKATFKDVSNKNRHERIHAGTHKVYKCRFCDKMFSRTNGRDHHERIHTGEKPYNCGFCDKNFRDTSTLTVHLRRMHTNERAHACQLCEKAYPTMSALRTHEKLHNREKQRSSTAT